MQLFTVLTIAVLGLTASATPIADGPVRRDVQPSNATTTTGGVPFPFSYTEANINSLAAALDMIDSIPDDVASGGRKALKTWSKDHSALISSRSAIEDSLVERQNWIQIGNCVVQITKAIAEGYLPVAKLRRVKDLIKEAGGVYKAAKALLKADKWEDLKDFGDAFFELAKVLAGVDGIADTCFSMF
jgi:hypothetical protein